MTGKWPTLRGLIRAVRGYRPTARDRAKPPRPHWTMEPYDEALADFNRALELDPKDVWALAGRGKTYRKMGRYDEALADYDRALELDPKDPYVLDYRHQLTTDWP
jgi:tetratricopeptide (TPR) repeat protein